MTPSRMDSYLYLPPAICALFAHFVGDFLFQSDAMAKNKSGSFRWLTYHVATYSIVVGGFLSIVVGVETGVVVAAINAVAHFATDAVTSRVTSALWKKGEVHWFFVVIGADQFLHVAVLLWSLELFA